MIEYQIHMSGAIIIIIHINTICSDLPGIAKFRPSYTARLVADVAFCGLKFPR